MPCQAPKSDVAATKATTKRALLTGLRNGNLEKAVEKMEADEEAAAEPKAELEPEPSLEKMMCELFKAIEGKDADRAKTILNDEERQFIAEVEAEAEAKPNPMQVNFVDEQGTTSLHLAAAQGMEMVCVKIIGCAGFENLDARDSVGRTALHLLAVANLYPLVNTLLHRVDDGFVPFDVNAKDNKGQTALHAAANVGNTDICTILVGDDGFTEVDAKDAEGRTAAELAATQGHKECSEEILFEQGGQ